MLKVKLPVVDRIHPQSNKFATDTSVDNETTGNSKPNAGFSIRIGVGGKTSGVGSGSTT